MLAVFVPVGGGEGGRSSMARYSAEISTFSSMTGTGTKVGVFTTRSHTLFGALEGSFHIQDP